MDSLKQAVVDDVQNNLAALPERGLPGFPEAQIETHTVGELECVVRVKPNPDGHQTRWFEIRVKEMR